MSLLPPQKVLKLQSFTPVWLQILFLLRKWKVDVLWLSWNIVVVFVHFLGILSDFERQRLTTRVSASDINESGQSPMWVERNWMHYIYKQMGLAVLYVFKLHTFLSWIFPEINRIKKGKLNGNLLHCITNGFL